MKLSYYILIIILLITIMTVVARKKISNITRPFKLRGQDEAGDGSFGAPRKQGKRLHEGLDIKTIEGQPIYAPFSLNFIRIAKPYSKSDMTGAKYKHENGTLKIFYFKPILNKKYFNEGEKIGYSQDVSKVWGNKMKTHIHLELRNKLGKLLNPENYV